MSIVPQSKVQDIFDEIRAVNNFSEGRTFQFARLKREVSKLPLFEHRVALTAIIYIYQLEFESAACELKKLLALREIDIASASNVCGAYNEVGRLFPALDFVDQLVKSFSTPDIFALAGHVNCDALDIDAANSYLEDGMRFYKGNVHLSIPSRLARLKEYIASVEEPIRKAGIPYSTVKVMSDSALRLIDQECIIANTTRLFWDGEENFLYLSFGVRRKEPEVIAQLNETLVDKLTALPNFDSKVVVTYYSHSQPEKRDAF